VVGDLIRMKLAVLRHTATGERRTWVVLGAVVGLALAAGTIWLAAGLDAGSPVLADLLAVVFAMWTVGWLVGPVWGGEPVLRPDHFALLPVPRTRLAVGLLAAGLVGVTTAVTLVGLAALVVYGARLGAAAAAVAVPALVLQLLLVVALSRVATTVYGTVSRSRTGGALIAVLSAAMMVLTQWAWVVVLAVTESGVLTGGLPPVLSAAVRVLPSGWGVVAVRAAADGEWLLVAGALAGMVVVIGALVGVWARLLATSRSGRAVVRGPAHPARPWPGDRGGPVAVVVGKELRTWWRDPNRTQSLVVGPVFALMLGLLPLTFGSADLLPWAGVVGLVMSATFCSNLYAQDGTALWLLLLSPGTERPDVRGRQWAWLLAFGPPAVLLTVVLTAVSGQDWAWPWVLAVLAALLGGASGLVVLFSVAQLVPGPDPHRNRSSPMDHGDATGPAFALLVLVLLVPLPALGVLVAAALSGAPALVWAALPVGLLTGAVLAWWLGRAAHRRLARTGPELLQLMRTGRTTAGAATADGRPGAFDALGEREKVRVTVQAIVGSVALFPQALVPIGIKLDGSDSKVWFLALHLPDAWQWPVIAAMLVLGVGLYVAAARTYLRARRRAAEPVPA
jgi:hypothetical protein